MAEIKIERVFDQEMRQARKTAMKQEMLPSFNYGSHNFN